MKRSLGATVADAALACRLTAHATLCVGAEEFAQLRRDPGPPRGQWAPTLLKHADEQTVAAMAALLRALEKRGAELGHYRDWSVLAAPTLFGRDPTAVAVGRFRVEGAWGISPHMIPHYTLHAVSGTLSQALKIHGPNFGISGGPDAPGEAFLLAASLVNARSTPGVLLVLTGHDREKLPGDGTPRCEAVALALQRDGHGPCLRTGPWRDEDGQLPAFSLSELRGTLEHDDWHSARWALPGGGWLELQNGGTQEVRP